jgi:hypothetical protein
VDRSYEAPLSDLRSRIEMETRKSINTEELDVAVPFSPKNTIPVLVLVLVLIFMVFLWM